MNILSNKKLTKMAQRLRREMTKEERKLWYGFLKTLPITVKRQKVIEKYIVDFCIDQVKLVIEIDGSQYYIEAGEASDKERDAVLKRLGYTIYALVI